MNVSFGLTKESIKMAAKYIHERQTTDGGYFFARIPPGNLLDTFFAVESLRMLGFQHRRVNDLENFVSSFQPDYALGNIHALYLAMGIIKSLGKSLQEYHCYAESALNRFDLAELVRFERLDSEVVSELKHIFEAVTVFNLLDVRFDKKSVTEFVLSLFNTDGGFGRNSFSTLSTTFYAVQTLALLDYPKFPELTQAFLIKMVKKTYYIEDLFYLLATMSLLGQSFFHLERELYTASILDYQRINGGFARARPIGIPTLEYTYYAISMLNLLQEV
jgi:hypothetical protein